MLGYGAGAVTGLVWKRLRPLLLELLTAGYRLVDTICARAAMKREDLEDLVAEARARARGVHVAEGGHFEPDGNVVGEHEPFTPTRH